VQHAGQFYIVNVRTLADQKPVVFEPLQWLAGIGHGRPPLITGSEGESPSADGSPEMVTY
jgi:hypothetical protein